MTMSIKLFKKIRAGFGIICIGDCYGLEVNIDRDRSK